MRAFGHRSRTMEMGFAREDFAGKPVIAIVNTWSDTNTCHSHMRQRAEEVKRGVWQAGGFPVELPAMSVGEQMTKLTSMMYRNFLAMETEELLRSQPVDGVVLMGCCDKTTPGLIMGAISMGLPAIYVPAGAMLRGHFQGATLGSGTDVFKYWEDLTPAQLCTQESFNNAIMVDMALSGSTNTMIHLVAMAGRAGIELPLERFDEISKKTSVLCNLKPAGIYLMEDFYYSGGLRAMLS